MSLQENVKNIVEQVLAGKDFIPSEEDFNNHPTLEGLVQACLAPVRLIDVNLANLMIHINSATIYDLNEMELTMRFLNKFLVDIVSRLPRPVSILELIKAQKQKGETT